LPDDDALDIHPILSTAGERFHHDEVLGGAGSELNLGGILEKRCPLHRQFLKWQGSQGNVKPYASRGLKEKDPVLKRKLGRVRDSSLERLEEDVNERLLAAKAGEKGQVCVHCYSRLTPTEDRNPAYKTKTPAVLLADFLQLGSRLDDLIHELVF
jgi:hypothetical protein